jgi:hypothetical protein
MLQGQIKIHMAASPGTSSLSCNLLTSINILPAIKKNASYSSTLHRQEAGTELLSLSHCP